MKCLQKFGIGPILLSALLALTLFSVSEPVAAQALPSGGGVVVTPSTPGFSPSGPASNNAYGVYESLTKSASTGRVGYPSVPVANQSAMSGAAARNAMRGLWRLAGWGAFAGAVVYMGGEFLQYLQCSTNDICKPAQPQSNAGPYTRKFEINTSSCNSSSFYYTEGCWTPSHEVSCSSRGIYNSTWAYYSTGSNFSAGSAPCYGRRNSDGLVTQLSATGYRDVAAYCVSPSVYQNGSCVSGSASVPATDSDLERAADAYRSAQPQRFVDDLKLGGKWAPDQNVMTAPQPDASSAPIIRELPETKIGAPAGNKVEKITPHTAAKPAADAQSVNVYNYNVTTVTHTDGTTDTEVAAESPNLDIPDDYAREDTQQDIADDVSEINDNLQPNNLPTFSNAPTFGESLTRLNTRLAASPIGQAVQSVGAGSTTVAGVCPTGDFTVFNESFSIDAHCVLFDSNSSVISGVMWALWIIAAVLVFLSA